MLFDETETETNIEQIIEQEIIEKIEPVINNDIDVDTVNYLRKYFINVQKVGKDDIIFYADRKTMFGKKILATDKIKEIGIINIKNISVFISTSYKLVKETEIEEVARKYITIGADRRVPIVVERYYMDNEEFISQRRKVMEEFL